MKEQRISTKMLYIKSVKPHFHKEEIELIFVIKGTVTIRKVEREITITEGEMTFVNKYVVHSLVSEGAYVLSVKIRLNQFRHIFSHMDYVEFVNNDEFITLNRPFKADLNHILRELIVNEFNYTNNTEALKNVEWLRAKQFNEENIMQMLFNFYQLITHSKEPEIYPTQELVSRYYEVSEYVMTHIQEKITVEDILDKLYMNTTYFSQFMKRMSGVSFKTFLQYRKIMIVECYLLESDLSIVEVANNVGMYDMKTFYTSIKRVFGKSPKSLRESLRNIEDDFSEIFAQKEWEDYVEKFYSPYEQETTTYKVYWQLAHIPEDEVHMWKGVQVALNPFQHMNLNNKEFYRPFKYFGALLSKIYRLGIDLNIHYPIEYLADEEYMERFGHIMSMMQFREGVRLKYIKVTIMMKNVKELDKAKMLQKNIQKRFKSIKIYIQIHTNIE
ncbi:MAG: AraC family transcriptional regulator [Cellulosilyticaceae bacterium]